MTCKFFVLFLSDTVSQLKAVCNFSYNCHMLLCCRQKCVNTLTLFKAKELYQEGI